MLRIPAGTSMGIYLTFIDPILAHFIFLRPGTSAGAVDMEDENMVVREGIAKQWNPCNT